MLLETHQHESSLGRYRERSRGHLLHRNGPKNLPLEAQLVEGFVALYEKGGACRDGDGVVSFGEGTDCARLGIEEVESRREGAVFLPARSRPCPGPFLTIGLIALCLGMCDELT